MQKLKPKCDMLRRTGVLNKTNAHHRRLPHYTLCGCSSNEALTEVTVTVKKRARMNAP
jgi:hypothetical protein